MQDSAIDRRSVIGGLAASTLIVGCQEKSASPASENRIPNIIFIMADDLGYADLGCTGSQYIRTPHIDSLAKNGLFFSDGYSNSSICSPSRTALLSGSYQYRFEIGLEEPYIPRRAARDGLGFPSGRPTIASVMKDNGYETALVGKWHLGLPPVFNPRNFGYDHYFGIVGGAADYFRHKRVIGGKSLGLGLFENEAEIERVGYLTDLLGDKAVEIIEGADEKPLFMSLHFTAPHWPWEGREDQEISRLIKDFYHYDGGSLETYANMVSAMDDNVGKILTALKSTGKLDNTIVIFTSDNGGERFSNTWPFTGVKGELLEGGIRVPLLIQWPDRIKGGQQTDQVMVSMDFLPTLLGMIGETVGVDKFDGKNLAAQILDNKTSIHRTLYWRFKANEQTAVRDGAWKYLSLGGKEHLFNVAEDPRERADLKEVHSDIFKDLKDKYETWNATMLPYPAKSYSEDVRDNYPDRY